MKVIEFRYVDVKGKETSKRVATIHDGSTNVKAIDLCDLDKLQEEEFLIEYKELLDKQHLELLALMKVHDLTYSFRQYKQTNMSDVKNIKI